MIKTFVILHDNIYLDFIALKIIVIKKSIPPRHSQDIHPLDHPHNHQPLEVLGAAETPALAWAALI